MTGDETEIGRRGVAAVESEEFAFEVALQVCGGFDAEDGDVQWGVFERLLVDDPFVVAFDADAERAWGRGGGAGDGGGVGGGGGVRRRGGRYDAVDGAVGKSTYISHNKHRNK